MFLILPVTLIIVLGLYFLRAKKFYYDLYLYLHR